MKNYMVKWQNTQNPQHHGHGQPMTREVAQAWADTANRMYPHIPHKVVLVSDWLKWEDEEPGDGTAANL
jgi:hypothetical protein